MLKNGLLTLLFAFIPGAGQMYQVRWISILERR